MGGLFLLLEEITNPPGKFNHDLMILFKIYSASNSGFTSSVILICREKFLCE